MADVKKTDIFAQYGIDEEYSWFEKDVARYASERLGYMVPGEASEEAFSSPGALVDALADENMLADISRSHRWVAPEDAVRYLEDIDMEDVCAVMDSSGKLGALADKVLENPGQAVCDVYAEEAKHLLSRIPFYFNQGIRQEQATESLSREDMNQIRCELEGKTYKREEDVVRFRGVEDGKPFTAEFEYKKMRDKIENWIALPGREPVVEELNRLADKAARDFRVAGPREAYAGFNLGVKVLAKDVKTYDRELSEGLTAWHEDVKGLFRTTGSYRLEKPVREKANLRTRARDDRERGGMERVG